MDGDDVGLAVQSIQIHILGVLADGVVLVHVVGETGIIHVPHDEDIIRTPGMPYFKLKYLRSFVNVYHTPHMAFFTAEAAEQMAECGINSIYEILTAGKSSHEIPC